MRFLGVAQAPKIDIGVRRCLAHAPMHNRTSAATSVKAKANDPRSRRLAFEQARSTPRYFAPPSAKNLRTTDRTPAFRPFHAAPLGPFGAK
jgi:hypothetical protein